LGFTVHREYEDLAPMIADKHVVLQVLVNLLSNARHALKASELTEKDLRVRLYRAGADRVAIEVRDNGVGIAIENMDRIFAHGFTTKEDGHGIGLHMSAIAAKALGGSLTCQSEGRNKGASFVFEIPISETKEGEPWRPTASSSSTITV